MRPRMRWLLTAQSAIVCVLLGILPRQNRHRDRSRDGRAMRRDFAYPSCSWLADRSAMPLHRLQELAAPFLEQRQHLQKLLRVHGHLLPVAAQDRHQQRAIVEDDCDRTVASVVAGQHKVAVDQQSCFQVHRTVDCGQLARLSSSTGRPIQHKITARMIISLPICFSSTLSPFRRNSLATLIDHINPSTPDASCRPASKRSPSAGVRSRASIWISVLFSRITNGCKAGVPMAGTINAPRRTPSAAQ
jgi:hypothetical protein